MCDGRGGRGCLGATGDQKRHNERGEAGQQRPKRGLGGARGMFHALEPVDPLQRFDPALQVLIALKQEAPGRCTRFDRNTNLMRLEEVGIGDIAWDQVSNERRERGLSRDVFAHVAPEDISYPHDNCY